MDFYVYALLDTRKPGPFRYGRWSFDFEPFYIGKGFGRRMYRHDRLDGANLYKDRKIRSILKDTGNWHEVVIKRAGLTEKEAFDLESRLIELIGRSGQGPLTNLTNGGEGICGHRHSRATRKHMSEVHAKRPTADKRVWRERIAAAMKESPRSKESFSNGALLGHSRMSKKTKAAWKENARTVWQCRTQEEVAAIVKKRNQTVANKPTAEKLKTAERRSRAHGSPAIAAYDASTGKFVARFTTQRQASAALGVARYTIYCVLHGIQRQAKGYFFKPVY